MDDYDDGYIEEEEREPPRPYDAAQGRARRVLEKLFEERPKNVFFSRQLEVKYEDRFYHWITNRAIRELGDEGRIVCERRPLKTGSHILLAYNKAYRYYKRDAQKICDIVEQYSDTKVGKAIDMNGEALVLQGFARNKFVMQGENTREFKGKKWRKSEHLTYIDYKELETKLAICKTLRIKPVFVVRMMPRHWIDEINRKKQGFSLILKYQLYPFALQSLAEKVKDELELPVDTPRALEEGTMQRFLKWHGQNV